MSEAFGPGWGFVKAWMEAWVSAPGSIAGIAIVFGEFVAEFLGEASGPPPALGRRGCRRVREHQSDGRALGRPHPGDAHNDQDYRGAHARRRKLLLRGSRRTFRRDCVEHRARGATSVSSASASPRSSSPKPGWTDVTHVAGEVANPKKTLDPLGIGLIVFGIHGSLSHREPRLLARDAARGDARARRYRHWLSPYCSPSIANLRMGVRWGVTARQVTLTTIKITGVLNGLAALLVIAFLKLLLRGSRCTCRRSCVERRARGAPPFRRHRRRRGLFRAMMDGPTSL